MIFLDLVEETNENSKHQAVMSQVPHVIDSIAQAFETAVLSGQNQATLVTQTKAFFSFLPIVQAETVVRALPAERQRALTTHLSS